MNMYTSCSFLLCPFYTDSKQTQGQDGYLVTIQILVKFIFKDYCSIAQKLTKVQHFTEYFWKVNTVDSTILNQFLYKSITLVIWSLFKTVVYNLKPVHLHFVKYISMFEAFSLCYCHQNLEYIHTFKNNTCFSFG